MTRQVINKTIKSLKYSAEVPYVSDDAAEDAIDYKDGGGGSMSADVGAFYIQKPGQGTYIVRAKIEESGFFFTLTHGDGTPITEASGLLSYIKIYNSSQSLLATTTEWDTDLEKWRVSLDNSGDADPNGYFAAYNTTEYGLATQYPYRWKPQDKFDSEDLIQAGDYSDTIPYYKTTYSIDSCGTCPDYEGCTLQEPSGGVDCSPYNKNVEVVSSVPYRVRYLASGGTTSSYWGNNNPSDCRRNTCAWCDENACERWAVRADQAGEATVIGGGGETNDPKNDPLDVTSNYGVGGGTHTIMATFTGPDPIGTDKACCNVGPCPDATTSQPMAMMCWRQGFSLIASVNYD